MKMLVTIGPISNKENVIKKFSHGPEGGAPNPPGTPAGQIPISSESAVGDTASGRADGQTAGRRTPDVTTSGRPQERQRTSGTF